MQAHNPKVVGSNPTPATNVRPVLIGGFIVCGMMGRFWVLRREVYNGANFIQ